MPDIFTLTKQEFAEQIDMIALYVYKKIYKLHVKFIKLNLLKINKRSIKMYSCIQLYHDD